MENQLLVFENHQFGSLEIIIIEGKPFFPATDSARILGYKNPHKAVNDHCKGDGLTNREVIDRLGRPQEKKYISEGNLYRLIIRSQLPEATAFESWVCDQILPNIREHGMYATDATIDRILEDPDYGIKLLLQLKESRKKAAVLQEVNETLEIALNESLKFYTVAKYNKVYGMNWSMEQCKHIGKRMSGYCRAHSIEIRLCETNDERFGNVNSYPLTAWEDFLSTQGHSL